jgi:hypothetical protein
VPIAEARSAVEELVEGREVVIDVPMLEDVGAFEGELRELGIRAQSKVSAAAEQPCTRLALAPAGACGGK